MRGGNMQQMMKQMGVDMEEINADKVEVHIGDKKMVFRNPNLNKMNLPQGEMFQLQGNYKEEKMETGPEEEDIELVMEKTDASREDAEKALENSEDVAEAVMELS